MADNAYVKELRGLMNNKAVQALMYVVPWAEGSMDSQTSREQGYRRLFGFNPDGSRRFMDSLDTVPYSPGKWRDPRTGEIKLSHDYGLYQLNKMNIPRLQKKIGRTDFSPETQDLMFLALLDEQPGFRKLVNSGDPKTWNEDQWKKLLNIPGKVYSSFPNGPGVGAKRSEAFLFSKVNEFLQGKGDKPVQYTGPKGLATSGGTIGRSSNGVDFLTPALDNLMGGSQGSANFIENTIRDIQGKNYANTGAVPYEVANTARSTQSVFGTMDTDPQVLVNRLFNQDPNTSYGLSFVGSSLRPTVNTVDANGNQVNMIELPNGRFINAETGDRMNEDGTVYEGTPVEYLQPDYVAPQNSPEAMQALREGNIRQAAPLTDMENEQAVVPVQSVADQGNAITGEYDYQGQLPTTAEAALPTGNTPLTSNAGSVASPIAYVDPNLQVVNALGGDSVTRALNASRPVDENLKELLRLA